MPLFESLDFWSIGGFVAGIAGIVLAIVFYLRGKKRKILGYEIDSTNLITQDMADIPGISILFDGQPVSNVISTTIKFINSGNQTISSNDFAAREPLGVSIVGQLFNDNHGIHVVADNPNSIPSIKIVDTEDNRKYIQIEIDFLKPKQSICITLLHDGPLTVSGELKTGKVVQTPPYNREFHIRSKMFSFLSTLIVCIFPALATNIIIDDFTNIDIYQNSQYLPMSIILTLSIIAISFSIYSLIIDIWKK